MSKVTITTDEVEKIAKLASLSLQPGEAEVFADQFTATIDIVDELSEIDTSGVAETYQVNNLQNVTREDIVDDARILPQEVALREAKNTHNGFIVVKRILDN